MMKALKIRLDSGIRVLNSFAVGVQWGSKNGEYVQPPLNLYKKKEQDKKKTEEKIVGPSLGIGVVTTGLYTAAMAQW